MNTLTELNFDQTCILAMRLVTNLNSLGVLSNVRLDDSLRVTVESDYGFDKSVGKESADWEFQSFIDELQHQIDQKIADNNRLNKVRNLFGSLSTEDLTALLNTRDDEVRYAIARAYQAR